MASRGRKLTDDYLAGFFDGEGCVLFDKHSIRVTITNTYLPILAAVCGEFGGSVRRRAPRKGNAAGVRTLFDWVVAGDRAVQFLTRMRPHLIEKGPQADLAMAARFYGANTAMFRALNEKLKARKRIDHGF